MLSAIELVIGHEQIRGKRLKKCMYDNEHDGIRGEGGLFPGIFNYTH